MSSTKITPRDYQRRQIDDVYRQWQAGNRNVLNVLPTGGGKTVEMAAIASESVVPGVAIAHRKELINQISRAMASFGVRHNIIAADSTVKSCISRHVELFGRSFYDPRAKFTVSSVDTLAVRADKLAQWANTVGLWMIDECFPAGTLVDGRPIESLQVGDMVTAFDEATGEFHLKPVVRLFKNPMPNYMVQVNDTWTTANHPFYVVGQGWVKAKDLTLSMGLLTDEGTLDLITNLSSKYRSRNLDDFVYNIEVADLHTYCADGVVVHNCHHVLSDNKWGKAVTMFPNAWGVGFTATPVRADKRSLARVQKGVFDAMVTGPTMRELITMGNLCDYRIFAPPASIDRSAITISANGEFSEQSMRKVVHESKIVGDIVGSYQRFAAGKRGITFVVDVEQATEVAAAYRAAGVRAECVSAKTPDAVRESLMRKFEQGALDQLVNVDLFGEGLDVPAVEVVSMGRPTESYGLYCLDPLTEILTPTGWKNHADVSDCTEVVAFDSTSGVVSVQPITGRVHRPLYVDEAIFGVTSPHLDIAVSDQHDMLVKSRSLTSKNWMKQTAKHVSQRKGLFRVPVAGQGLFTGSGLTDCELHFLGWFLTDGSLNRKTNAIHISQSVAKTEHCSSIRSAITGCNFKFGERVNIRKDSPDTHNDLRVFTISMGKPRGTDKDKTGWGRLSAWINKSMPAVYDSLTRSEFEVLLAAMRLGDGSNQFTHDYRSQTLTLACGDNEVMADRLQAMCVVRGFRCNKSVQQYGNRGRWFYLHIKDVTTSTIAGTDVKDGTVSGEKPYVRARFARRDIQPAFVWCVSNPLGTLITRRNGKVVIVGNCQQFGRALRKHPGKNAGIIIDHVGNVVRHGLPDAPRNWTLIADQRGKRSARDPDAIPVTTCPECFKAYESLGAACPYCGFKPQPAGRSRPEQVDGDLCELDPSVLAQMRGEVARVDGQPIIPYGATEIVAAAVRKRWAERQDAQDSLRRRIAEWAGVLHGRGAPDAEIYRRFYHRFGVDIMTAQTLNARDALELEGRIQ